MNIGFISGNLILDLSFLGWAFAQLLKVIFALIQGKKINFQFLISSGGMPSSHSSLVCACATSVGMIYGFTSPLFSIATVLAMVVMYDAANVRKAAGEQAMILNYIMKHWAEMPPALMGKQLKELLGHTPTQVLAGALLGIAVGFFGVRLF